MTVAEFKKHLGRNLTVMLIPHNDVRPIRLNLSVALLSILAISWTCLTVWSGFIASRHVDYWRTKADSQIMRAKVWYFAQQIKKSREYIDHVRETEINLQNLLNMKTKQAIVESDQSLGGPSAGDEKQLEMLLTGRLDNMTLADMHNQFDHVQQAENNVISNYHEISQFIHEQHDIFRATPLKWPTTGRLTSVFGVRKSPYEEETTEFHRGIDIANDLGTPVKATADGIVKLASWQGGYGRLVVIEHAHGFRTFYGHNSQLLVKPGDVVKRGQTISLMGTSGRSTGYHLHYEIWQNGQAVNPMKFVKAESTTK